MRGALRSRSLVLPASAVQLLIRDSFAHSGCENELSSIEVLFAFGLHGRGHQDAPRPVQAAHSRLSFQNLGDLMSEKKKNLSVFLILIICMTITMTNSAMVANSHALPTSAESLAMGGSCSSLMNGFTLGMGVATLIGCAWCPLGAIAAKVASAYVC
jgi:hypothetical protein